VKVLCSGQGVLNHAIIIHYANGGMATITMASTGSFGYPKELLEAIGQGGIVACDHMLEVRTGGIAGAPPVTCYPMLNDRHPQVGRQGGLHGWLEKSAGPAMRRRKPVIPCGNSRPSRTKGIVGCRPNSCGKFAENAGRFARRTMPFSPPKSYLEERPVDVSEISPPA
jgi:hypothetical protein